MTTAELLDQLDHNPNVGIDSHGSWMNPPEDEP